MMEKYYKRLFFISLFIISAFLINGQQPISKLSWKYVATRMPDDWYGSDESGKVAENILLYQRNVGGWPKNIEMHRLLTERQKDLLRKQKDTLDAILDNDATTTEMKFMARMYNNTHDPVYRDSFMKGLNYILEAQYDNGGWPMFYPLKRGYYTHINFNDNCIVNIMELLQDINSKSPLYTFISDNETVERTKEAFQKGLECILGTQMIVNGKPTVWCAQHDEHTLMPAGARSYELPSFSGGESSGIVELLMGIPSPTPEIIRSVQGAYEWFVAHKLKNVKWEYFTNNDGLRDRRIVTDPSAGDMWARFYDLETEKPFVCDRDGIKKSSLEEIGYERRNGYSWYTEAPGEVLKEYPAWERKWVKRY